MILSVRYTSASTAVAITMTDGTVWHTDAALPADTEIRRALREWLDAGNVIAPYEATPTSIPALTARQLRLGLLSLRITEEQVDAVIAAIPDEIEREAVKIEWKYSNTFDREHALIAQISAALDLTTAQVDAAWTAALQL